MWYVILLNVFLRVMKSELARRTGIRQIIERRRQTRTPRLGLRNLEIFHIKIVSQNLRNIL